MVGIVRRVERHASIALDRGWELASVAPGLARTPDELAGCAPTWLGIETLGTAADGRAAARAGRHADMARIYAGQLELPEAIAESAQMLALAEEKPSALLCFEREPAHCHRTLLLDAVAPDADVVDLFA